MEILPLQTLVCGILIGFIYGLIALGLTIIFGVMKILNFSHGEFVMLGAYTSYWLFVLFGVDPIISLFFNIPLFFVIGLVIQKFIINRIVEIPFYPILITFGVATFLQNSALLFWTGDYRAVKTSYTTAIIPLGGIVLPFTSVITSIVSLIMAGAIFLFLNRTELGQAIRATSQDKEAALMMGINVYWMYLVTAGISAAVAGVGGSLLSLLYVFYPAVASLFMLKCFTVCVLGGLGSVTGSLVAGLIMGVAESFTVYYIGAGYGDLMAYVLLIVILLVRPSGIFGRGRV